MLTGWRLVGCSYYSPPPVKNTHLVFITFYFHFLSKTCGFLGTIFGYKCFISNLIHDHTSPMCCTSCLKKFMLTGRRLVDCFLGSQWNFFQALIKLIASLSVWINKRFQIFLVTLDSTFTKTILRCLNFNSAFCITKNLSNVSIFRLI